MKQTKKDHANIYEEITARIVAAIEAGLVPWVRPWDAARFGSHRNAVTGRPYRGINVLLLNLVATMLGYADPRWLTFRNAEQLGGHVRKGEKGVRIVFWKFLPLPAAGAGDEPGLEPDREGEQQVIPFARAYTVFNAAQCEGLDIPLLDTGLVTAGEGNEAAERVLALPEIRHHGDRAVYSPAEDRITLPVPAAFESRDHYYATAFHEIVHWTGHPARLARTFGERFGDQAYAFEELVAEIGAAFLGGHAGLPFAELRHPEYINGWLSVLKGDNRAIFTGAAKAQAAADFVLAAAGLASGEEAEKVSVAA